MSIYDKASLVLIPSGTKTSKVYSQKPVNGDGDFTFSRSTAATRVNADGNIEKETQNLLLQSNSFDTTWTNTSGATTGGQSGYDGGSDAWLITKTAAWAHLRQDITSSGVQTFSVYAKANASTWIGLAASTSGTDPLVYIDLANETIDAQVSLIDATITDVGNDWKRVSMTFNASITRIRIYPAEANTGGGASGSIYIQDAQLNQGLIAQEVITTTTTALYGGITDNVPRLDYTDSSCPALLLEPQRTNIFPQSEYYNTLWSRTNSSVSDNQLESPEGFINASVLSVVSSSQAGISAFNTWSGNTTYSMSAFVKKKIGSYIGFGVYGDVMGDEWIKWNLDNGTSTANNLWTNANFEDFGNGWYRISATITTTSGSTSKSGFKLNLMTDVSYSSGNVGDEAYIYGVQLEEGSKTSYIPTYGTSVTRNADVCGNAGNSTTFNSTEGVLYSEIKALDNTGGLRLMQLSDGTNSNRVSLYYDGSSAKIYANVVVNNNANPMSYGVTITDYVKVAIAWSENYFSLWVNGSEVDNDTNGNTFSVNTLNVLNLSLNGVYPFLGDVKQILTFNSKLSNEELAALTTI